MRYLVRGELPNGFMDVCRYLLLTNKPAWNHHAIYYRASGYDCGDVRPEGVLKRIREKPVPRTAP